MRKSTEPDMQQKVAPPDTARSGRPEPTVAHAPGHQHLRREDWTAGVRSLPRATSSAVVKAGKHVGMRNQRHS